MVTIQSAYQQRLDAIYKRQSAQAVRVVDNSWYQFLVTPTCPPSTSLWMRGGLISANRDWSGWAIATTALNRQWTVPEQSYDLTDASRVLYDVTFSAPNTFRAFLVCLALPDNRNQPEAAEWLLRLRTDYLEYETAGNAEAGLMLWLTEGGYVTNQPWADVVDNPPVAMPLSGLILKNNGTIGGNGNFLPIDRVNRGRSYIFMDVRPRWLSA